MSVRARTRRLLPYLIVAAGGFLAAYLFVLFFVFPADLVPDDGELPNVVGLYYDDAARRLREQDYSATRGDERYHVTAPANTVLSQQPPGGSTQPRGATVTLAISRGQLEAEVPSVLGLTRRQAQTALQNVGFELGDVRQRESASPRGEVIAVDPVAGTILPVPAAIALTVSSGPSTMGMPDVVGQAYAQARVFLEQLGLRPDTPTFDSTSFMPEYTILGQTPVAGAQVAPGTRVSLRVSGSAP